MSNFKKFVFVSVSIFVVIWSVGGVFAVPVQAASAGDLIKMAGNSAVYYYDGTYRYVFPNESTYKSWYSDFSGVVTISQAEMFSIDFGGNVTMRPGTWLVKVTSIPKVYAVEPGGVLRWIDSEARATALYGSNWNKKIKDVDDTVWVNYTPGSTVSTDKHPVGSLVKYTGSSTVYYVDTGDVKRPISSEAALAANMFRNEFVQETTISYTDGSSVTGKEGDLVNVAGAASGSVVVGGSALSVALASDTTAASTLPDGSAYNKVTKLNLSAGTDGAINVTGFRVTRGGFSLNADFTGVMVFDSAGKRHGNVVTLSEDKALIMFTADPIVVPVGQTVPVWVQVNIDAAQTTNGTFNFGVATAADVFTSSSATVSGSFPVTGNTFSVIDGSSTLGALDIDASTISAASRSVDLGSLDYQIGKFKFYETASKEDIKLTSVRFYNNGNTTDADLTNLKLKNDATGDVLGTATSTTDKYVTFDFATPLTVLKGQNKTLVISADVVNGSSRTAQFIIQNDYDVNATGVSTGGGLLAKHATNLSGDATPGFPVGEAANYNTITVASGSLTINKDTSSPSGNVSQGQNSVTIGAWKVEASGEDIEIQKADMEVGGTTDSGDVSGSVSLMIGDTTIYSTSSLTTLFNGTVDGTDQKTLSNYYTIKGGTSAIVKMVVNVASDATSAATFIGQLGDIYYKRLATNNYTSASDGVLISANTMTLQVASLTVVKNTAFGNQNVVGGGSSTKIGSYAFQASSSEGVNVSAVNVDMSAITGMTNMRLKKVNADSSETQVGSTVTSPSTTDDANSFSVGGTLNIAANSTVIVNVYVDMSSTAVTVYTDIDAADVTASGLSSGTSLSGNVPLAAVTGQTVTMRTSGTLLVENDGSLVEAVVKAGQTDVELARTKFTSQYEAIKITKLVFGSRRADSNMTSTSLISGTTVVATAIPINGVATFTGLTLNVPKDSSLVVKLQGSFTSSGTLMSTEEVRFGLDSLEANGVSSGNSVYEKGVTTTAVVGDLSTGDTAVALTVGSTEGFSVGDVVQVHQDSAGVSSFTGVVTAVGSATSLTVLGPQPLVNCATATTSCFITKWATREAITSSTTAVTLTDATGIAIDVTSTRGFAVGDVARIEGISGAVDDGGFYTVTAVTDGNTMTVIGVGEVTASPTIGTTATDRITRMATTASTQTRTATDDIVANTTSLIDVDSTIGFAVGDVVVLNSTSSAATTKQLYIVDAVTDSDTLSLIGKGAQTNIPADSWVTELASTRTTTISTASVITADTASALTVTSVSGFAVGDIVYVQDDATAGGDLYMVSAVSTTTVTVIGETAFTASAGAFVTRLASSTSNGKVNTVEDVVPVITVNAASPSGTASGGTNAIAAIFDVQAAGDVALTIKSIALTRGGNIATRVATTDYAKIYDYTSGSLGSLLGTGGAWSGTAAGSTVTVTLDTPFTITAGTTAKIAVTVPTTSAQANDTFQVYIDNTSAIAGLFGGVSWYYTATAPSPGTEPTNASPSTLSNSYPVYGGTLKY
ncbi:MAG: hypothetical protein V1712_02520 [Patescibacteria group bacterium]